MNQPSSKYDFLNDNSLYGNLSEQDKRTIQFLASEYRLSYQDCRKLIIISRDFQMWETVPLHQISLPEVKKERGRDRKKRLMDRIENIWLDLKNKPTDYSNFSTTSSRDVSSRINISEHNGTILGHCPVASEKTRCCNLYTLDAVMSCAYDCSYCSIQSFYNNGQITFHKDLKHKLNELELEENKDYHIGTGQGSDSLIWGNKNGLLDDLCAFAQQNPNVILEMKTKSDNIDYFLNNRIPENIILTWSLNPQVIIENEETGTASLEQRLEASQKVSDKGILTGFHFHPMFYYQNWEQDYSSIARSLLERFQKKPVIISMGTLTYSRKVINKIRERDFKTKVLQIPLENIAGKFSYPFAIKQKMFKTLYSAFRDWQKDVFFYLCMEDINLWLPVFGFQYSTNKEFESEMIKHYRRRINEIRS